jgi:hypothetical protein
MTCARTLPSSASASELPTTLYPHHAGRQPKLRRYLATWYVPDASRCQPSHECGHRSGAAASQHAHGMKQLRGPAPAASKPKHKTVCVRPGSSICTLGSHLLARHARTKLASFAEAGALPDGVVWWRFPTWRASAMATTPETARCKPSFKWSWGHPDDSWHFFLFPFPFDLSGATTIPRCK